MVHLPKFVREKRGWSYSRMARELTMSVTSYKVFETSGKSYAPERLQRLFELSGLTLEKFWREFEKDAQGVQRKKRSDAIELESDT
jgi:transcriptional regulator with XRE-family HTH domain